MSPELFSSLLTSSQLISAFFPHSSSQLFSAFRSSCQLIFCLLISSLTLLASSQLFSHLLSWSQPLFSSSHLISALLSALSNHLSSSLAQKTCSKNGSQRQSKWPLRFPQRRFYTDFMQLLNKARFTHNCRNKPLDTASFYTEKALHTASFYREKLLYTEACTQRSLYTAKLLHTEAVTPSKLLHREAFTEALAHTHTHRNFYTQKLLQATAPKIAAPKPDLRAEAKKYDDFEALYEHIIFKGKSPAPKLKKICWQITIAAVMQPLQYDLRGPAAKDTSITHAAAVPSNLDAATTMRSTELQNTIRTTRNGVRNCSFKTGWISAPKPKKDDFEALCKNNFKRKIASAAKIKLRKSADKSLSQPRFSLLQNHLRCPAAKDNNRVDTHPRQQATLKQPLQCDRQNC